MDISNETLIANPQLFRHSLEFLVDLNFGLHVYKALRIGWKLFACSCYHLLLSKMSLDFHGRSNNVINGLEIGKKEYNLLQPPEFFSLHAFGECHFSFFPKMPNVLLSGRYQTTLIYVTMDLYIMMLYHFAGCRSCSLASFCISRFQQSEIC
ncbi:unnamed protein product [Brugia timori]|uniref:Transmembrane protein n=1 Tax=Brugia timori TaxID=42155 RepID=A0A0R3Q5B5_9BILA|nr:unnamed protein product [Brugia timori]